MYINHLPASHLSMTSSPETTILTSCACLFLFLVLELATPAASSKSMGPFMYYVSSCKGGAALCVEMGFYADVSWESRCNMEINV